MKHRFAVIFDMDGILLDTEPLWGESMMKVALQHQVELSYADLRFTTGLRIHEVTAFWKDTFPWGSTADSDEVAEDILDHIIDNSKQHASVMPGIKEHLAYLQSKHIPIGVATSSPHRMAHTLLEHFGIASAFEHISTGDQVPLGKPHPAVYLDCAKKLNIPSYQCIAVEDSINGMVAAKAARMKVVAIPDAHKFNHPAFGLADLLYKKMSNMPLAAWTSL